MLRRGLAILGWGTILVAASLFAFEFFASGMQKPDVPVIKWIILAVAVLLIVLGHRREGEVTEMHLPH